MNSSELIDFSSHNFLVVLLELFLLLLFEVEVAAVVFGVPVLGAEDEGAFALEAEQADLLPAGPAELLVSLYLVNSIHPITYLNLWRLFLALLLHRRHFRSGLF